MSTLQMTLKHLIRISVVFMSPSGQSFCACTNSNWMFASEGSINPGSALLLPRLLAHSASCEHCALRTLLISGPLMGFSSFNCLRSPTISNITQHSWILNTGLISHCICKLSEQALISSYKSEYLNLNKSMLCPPLSTSSSSIVDHRD